MFLRINELLDMKHLSQYPACMCVFVCLFVLLLCSFLLFFFKLKMIRCHFVIIFIYCFIEDLSGTPMSAEGLGVPMEISHSFTI